MRACAADADLAGASLALAFLQEMLPSSSDGTSTGSPSPLVVATGAGEANPIADAILRGLSAAPTCHSAIPKVLEVLVGVSRARWLSPSRGRVALLSLAPFTEREGVDSLPCSVMAGGGRSDIGEAGATRALHSPPAATEFACTLSYSLYRQ